jgi:hypothetical protein
LVEFTLEKQKTSKCFPVVVVVFFSFLFFFSFFFWMEKTTKFVKKNYWVVRVRYYVRLLSYWIMEEELGGGVLFGLFFSINEPFTHSFIARKKKGPLSPPSHCRVISYL